MYFQSFVAPHFPDIVMLRERERDRERCIINIAENIFLFLYVLQAGLWRSVMWWWQSRRIELIKFAICELYLSVFLKRNCSGHYVKKCLYKFEVHFCQSKWSLLLYRLKFVHMSVLHCPDEGQWRKCWQLNICWLKLPVVLSSDPSAMWLG